MSTAPRLLRTFMSWMTASSPLVKISGLLVVVLLVSLSGVPNIAGLASTRALIVQRRTRPIAVAAGVGAGANLGLNLLLVPVWGLEGAAAAGAAPSFPPDRSFAGRPGGRCR